MRERTLDESGERLWAAKEGFHHARCFIFDGICQLHLPYKFSFGLFRTLEYPTLIVLPVLIRFKQHRQANKTSRVCIFLV